MKILKKTSKKGWLFLRVCLVIFSMVLNTVYPMAYAYALDEAQVAAMEQEKEPADSETPVEEEVVADEDEVPPVEPSEVEESAVEEEIVEVPPVEDSEVEKTAEEEAGATDESTEAETEDVVEDEGNWHENENGSSSVVVVENKEYEYKESGLKIEFSKIKDGSGEITVKEIELSDEQVANLGAISNKAWDITSEMENGTFEYELTLPVDENVDQEEVRVVYAEKKEDLDDENEVRSVDQEDVKVDHEKKEVVAHDLDHFTVYAVVTSDESEEKKIVICHATNAHNNPYGPKAQEVSVDSIFENKGHDEHGGAFVWFPGIKEEWGDIIPPFNYDEDNYYAGKNWSDEGQAIWANDCQVENDIESFCGDGMVNDDDEDCDYGDLNGESNCSAECKFLKPVCGDGNLIDNESFEIPKVDEWDIFENFEVPAWTAQWRVETGDESQPAPQIEIHNGVLGSASEGDNYVELDTDWDGPAGKLSGEAASIELSQEVPMMDGYKYRLTWDYAARPNRNNHLEVEVAGSVVFDSGNMLGGGSVVWLKGSHEFVSDVFGMEKISFIETGTPDSFGMLLDNVRLECLGDEQPEYTCDETMYAVNNSGELSWFDFDNGTVEDLDSLNFGSSASADDPFHARTYYVSRYGTSVLSYYDHETETNVNFGSTGVASNFFTKLAFNTYGDLFGLTDAHKLYQLNPASGAATLKGTISGVATGGDIVFDEEGTLYLIGTDGKLFTINLANLEASLVKATGHSPVTGMAYVGGSFYFSTGSSDVFKMDKSGEGIEKINDEKQEVINDLSSCLPGVLAECGDGIKNGQEQCDGDDGVTAGENFCSQSCQLVPIYDGGHECSDGSLPVLRDSYEVGSKDEDGVNVPLTSGVEYLFEATGAFGSSSGGHISDAGYTALNDWSNLQSQFGVQGTGDDFAAHALLGDMATGTVGVIDWGDYNSAHEYRKAYTPMITGNAQFLIGDRYGDWFDTSWQNQGGIGDNQGSLNLNVYECQETATVSVCKEDESGKRMAGWDMILSSGPVDGPTQIDVSSGDGTDSVNLTAGRYLIKTSGTYRYGSSAMIADAGYSYRPMNIPSGCDCWFSGHDLPSGSNGLMVQIDDSAVDWGFYNVSHEYLYVYNHAADGPINFSLYDNYYGDNVNNGNLQFEIYKIEREGTTEGDEGCVEFTGVSMGDYYLDELLKEYWENVSGTGLVRVNELSEEFIVVNEDNTPYCGDGIKNAQEQCDGNDGVSVGENFCSQSCQLVPIYDGEHECLGDAVPKYITGLTLNSQEKDPQILSKTMMAGNDYLLKASGTYQYTNNSQKLADPAYGTNNGFSSIRNDVGIWGTNRGVTSVLGDLGSGMGVIEWDDNHIVNTDHVYSKLVQPQSDLDAQFVISDWWSDWYPSYQNQSAMGDNSGELQVDLYQCVSPATIEGTKYNDANNDGAIAGDRGIYNWEIVTGKLDKKGEYAVDPKLDVSVDIGVLDAGKTYLLKVEGTFGAGDSITADAECSTRNGSPWDTLVENYESYGESLLDLEIDGAATDWGNCNPSHVYTKLLSGDGAAHGLLINDIYRPNNSGALTVSVYELLDYQADFTDSNGDYSFSVADSGLYAVCEIQQESWIQTFPNSTDGGCHFVEILNGDKVSGVDFANIELGDIHGIKWDDVNGNDRRDCLDEPEERVSELREFALDIQETCKLEPLLSGWTIFLDENDNQQLDEGEKHMDTSGEEEHFGWYWFEDLLPGEYKICEELQDGWNQSFPGDPECHSVSLPNDCSQLQGDGLSARVMTENAVATYCQFDFGNQFVKPSLQIEKSNDSEGPQAPGTIVNYSIRVTALGNNVNNVLVTDLPPEGFEYVPGSGSATQGSLEHVYASPGIWNLGNMAIGQTVTIAYQAMIGSDTQAGVYPDLAWADGADDRTSLVTAVGVNSDYVDGSFVGTNVEVESSDVAPTVTARADKHEVIEEEDKEVKVLGAAYLPATGADNIWLNIALLGMLLGGAMMSIGYLIRNNRRMNKIAGLVLGLALTGLFAGNALAAGEVSIRLSAPGTAVTGAFDLDFVALDVQDRTMTVECQKKGPSDSGFVQFGALINLQEGGDSDFCPVDLAVLSQMGDYEFKVIVEAEGDTQESDVVKTFFDGVGPDKPKYLEKDEENSCRNEVTFKTANDGQTVRVEIYRSRHTRDVVANEASRIQTITVGPNQKYSFDDDLHIPGCGDNYYYAARAFDSSGNASDVTEEDYDVTVEKTNIIEIEVPQEQPVGVAGAGGVVDVEGATETVTEETTVPEETETPTVGEGIQTEDDVEVLGEDIENSSMAGKVSGYFKGWKLLLWVLILAGFGWWGYKKFSKPHTTD